jgi:hypothetical protein
VAAVRPGSVTVLGVDGASLVAALLRKAATTSFPPEAAACRDKAVALRTRCSL